MTTPQPFTNSPIARPDVPDNHPQSFTFINYEFDYTTFTANFRYQGIDNIIFTESINFAPPLSISDSAKNRPATKNSHSDHPAAKFSHASRPAAQSLLEYSQTLDQDLLFRALFLCFILIGTSYYKAHPTPEVICNLPAQPIDPWQAEFFSRVYQEGLSQFAYENGLKRADLAHFHPTSTLIHESADALPVADLAHFHPTSVSNFVKKSYPNSTFPEIPPKTTSSPVQENAPIPSLYHTFAKKSRVSGDFSQKTSISSNFSPKSPVFAPSKTLPRILSLQSGGKDSLLTATLLAQHGIPYTAWYLTNSDFHPAVLDHLPAAAPSIQPDAETTTPLNPTAPSAAASDSATPSAPAAPLQIARRHLDLAHLKASGGLNGHVPVTYIVQSLALVQAILNGQTYILTSIGQEGNEPHAHLGDLPVNHQWSKTWPAEQLFAEYIRRYLIPTSTPSSPFHLGSPLRSHTELAIAEQFAALCWQTYGHSFSSCNEANYRQNSDNHALKWCGHCAKCANSYLLFAPFVPAVELQSLFGDQDLFQNPALTDFFKGLLGIDGVLKPFECVGEVAELRRAYHLRQPGYGTLPFPVPPSDFDFRRPHPMQSVLDFNRLAEDVNKN